MKQIILSSLLVFTLVNAFGQNTDLVERRGQSFTADTSAACNPTSIFTLVDQMPVYEGGVKQLEKDLSERLEFDKETNGTIYLTFTINCENKAYGFQVMRGIESTKDAMLIEELEKLQNWTSGSHKGKTVDCQKNIGVAFKKGKPGIPYGI